MNGHVPNGGTIAIMAGSRSLVTQRAHAQLMRLLAASVNHSDFIPDAVVSRSNGGADPVCERWADAAGLPIARFSTPWNDTDHPDAVVKQSPYGAYDARADCRRHQRMDIWTTIAIGTAIGARYGHHVAYRQLFETREEKRQQALDVTVDAADPTALDIGSWTLIGDFAGQLEDVKDGLTEAFDELEPHEDAPPIHIEDTIQTSPTRRQVAVATSKTLAWKGLSPTDEAVNLLHGLCRSLGDVLDALSHLGGNNDGRRIDAAEVRYALAQLDAHRLLRGFTPSTTTPRKLIAALLRADEPLQKSTLDTEAGVSAPSRRTYLPDLITAGLVTETDDGIRLGLSFDGTGDGEFDERLSDRYPKLVSNSDQPTVHMAAKVLRIGRDHHGPDGPATDVGWPYGTAAPPPDLRELEQPAVFLDDVLPALWGIAMEETYREETALRPPPKTTITAGPVQSQTALAEWG